jgi:hypothetical protein
VLPSTFSTASAPRFDPFAAQWLAYALPYRRFTFTLAGIGARLGADVVRYTFIAADFHHLLLAGFSGRYAKYFCASQGIAGQNRESDCSEH